MKHAHNIGQLMSDFFDNNQQVINEFYHLKNQVETLKKEVTLLKECGGDTGWMTLKKACSKLGISTDALAQQFRRGVYPEGVVWYQIGEPDRPRRPYMVHLQALRDHMARGKH
jgi:hypothetical protein